MVFDGDSSCIERECCCNCELRKPLMCHPSNGNRKLYGFIEDKFKFGKGSIMERCGWVCTAPIHDDGSFTFFDFDHGMCEMYRRKKRDENVSGD